MAHPLISGVSIGDPATDDASWEFQFRAAAIPASLLVATLIHFTALGPLVLRNFFGMWLHELGHASASWLCGRWAIPSPWMTYWGSERSVGVTVVMLTLSAVGSWWFFKRDSKIPAVACALMGVLTIFCTAVLTDRSVQVFSIFAGDAGAMVYGVAMMSTFYTRRDSRIVQGALRWGFVWWGAAAFVDAWATWIAARRDVAEIPFGVEEVGGQDVLSDATKLVDTWGWTEHQLVNRYFFLGVICLLVTVGLYVYGLLSSRRTSA